MSLLRTRWAALGAVVAITLSAAGVGTASVGSGERTVFVPITPCRIIDTRPAFQVGPRATPLGPNQTYTVSAHGTNGRCTIPADAVALSLNVTAVGATLPTFLTIWAAGQARPDSSSLNPAPGQPPTPNAVATDLSGAGQFSIYNLQGNVHVLADVNGYYADHHHDDRYYQKSHVDAVESNSKFINQNTLRNVDNFTASLGVGTSIGNGFHSSFVLPPNYTFGTPLTLRLNLIKIAVSACTLDLQPAELNVYRPSSGGPISGPTATAGISNPGPVQVPAGDNRSFGVTFTITSPSATANLRHGDSVTFHLATQGGSTCGPGVTYIHSAMLYYQ
jgi:hypothetical protein